MSLRQSRALPSLFHDWASDEGEAECSQEGRADASLAIKVPHRGNVHTGCPIFGMDGWSGKKGQNGTRQVGWLIKKGRPIFQPIMEETNLSNIPALKLFSTEL